MYVYVRTRMYVYFKYSNILKMVKLRIFGAKYLFWTYARMDFIFLVLTMLTYLVKEWRRKRLNENQINSRTRGKLMSTDMISFCSKKIDPINW